MENTLHSSVGDVLSHFATSTLSTTSLEHFFLDRIVFNNVIQETLFLYLTPLEFLRFARTCRLVYSIVTSYVKRTFNINRFLTRYFPDLVAFRALQARTGTLLSGSNALQFLDRTYYPESDLDLYIPKQCDRKVTSWLILSGYTFVPSNGQSHDLQEAIAQSQRDAADPLMPYDQGNMQAVYTFSKSPPSCSGPDLKVQCVISTIAPLELILKFHSTCVMNVVSYEKAYALYPRATLHNHRSLVCIMRGSPSQPEAFKNTKIAASTSSLTYMGDPLCWTISLDMEDMESSWDILGPLSTPLTQDSIRAASWDLSIVRSHVAMRFRVWKSPHLYWNYPAVSHHVVNYARRAILAELRVNVGRGEISPEHRGRFFDDEFVKHCIDFHSRHSPSKNAAT